MKRVISVDAEVEIEFRDGLDWETYEEDGKRVWRGDGYGFVDQEDLIQNLVWNALANGANDASRVDGWADLERGDITMRVVYTHGYID